MDLMKIAAQLFISKLGSQGSNLDLGGVMGALKGFLPTSGEDLDLAGLVGQFTQGGGGLASLASSWLGDGSNESFSPSQLVSLFGESKVSEFAGQLGLDSNTAASGLSGMLPDLIDQNSQGGNIMGNVAASAAKGFFKKFF